MNLGGLGKAWRRKERTRTLILRRAWRAEAGDMSRSVLQMDLRSTGGMMRGRRGWSRKGGLKPDTKETVFLGVMSGGQVTCARSVKMSIDLYMTRGEG